MTDFNTLLIANRGEIACRVIRTAKAMGLRTVAVYSDADAQAPHVSLADNAVHIGASPVSASYLDQDKVLAAAVSAGAGAIHPGYGFLSENAAFAEKVAAAGLVFVGPGKKAIEVMGDKARSKRAMIAAGVPCVPGYQGEDQSDATLVNEAQAIGFPLMVKAAAGGGGRGMRLVDQESELADAIKLARAEAQSAFGSSELIIEKAILQPRHVEIQVFADTHGNIIHLGERDCSVQRRHQKVIEEAPCPVMTPALREAMGTAAIDAARAVEYCGAGTVEFLLGPEQPNGEREFYFLEMNTRLQVEHPVTEAVTGLDLVELQLRVARGETLPILQDDVRLSGHAIEVRLYAEDPAADFLPCTGPILLWAPPTGPGLRVDDGIRSGGEVSPFYDPMVAKIIAHGSSREDARMRLIRGLSETALFGLANNRDFLIDALAQPAFASGAATTDFIAQTYGEQGVSSHILAAEDFCLAAVLQFRLAQQLCNAKAVGVADELLNWSSTGALHSVYAYQHGETTLHLQVRPKGSNTLHTTYQVTGAEKECSIEVIELDTTQGKVRVDGQVERIHFYAGDEGELYLARATHSFSLRNLLAANALSNEDGGGGQVLAPMHGSLVEVLVDKGTKVSKGDKLAVLEAMKMQHEIKAQVDGTVIAVINTVGSQVAAGDLILEITPAK